MKREVEEGVEEGTIRKRGRSFYRLEETHRRKVGGAGPSYVAALFFQGSCEPTPSHRRAFTARHSTSRIEISRLDCEDEKITISSRMIPIFGSR